MMPLLKFDTEPLELEFKPSKYDGCIYSEHNLPIKTKTPTKFPTKKANKIKRKKRK